MASIDKIYGTRNEWLELRAWLLKNKPEYVEKFMYQQPEVEGALANFDVEADEWLMLSCPIKFVQNRLREQYSSRWDRLKEDGLIGCLNNTGINSENFKQMILNMCWNNVNEEKPKDDRSVLCTNVYVGMIPHKCWYDENLDEFISLESICTLPMSVTHWMPLPKSPEK